MARTPQDVTDAELAILQVLWDEGPATIRRLTDVLYPGGTAAQYGTVQKLLERLEGKGCVSRDRTPWPHVVTAAIDRARGELEDRLGFGDFVHFIQNPGILNFGRDIDLLLLDGR